MTMDRRHFAQGAAALVLACAGRSARADAPLKVGYVPVLGAAPLILFQRAGLARKAGLDLDLVKLDAASSAMPALDAVATGVAPIVIARAAGSRLKIIASLATAGSGFVAVPALAAHFYANDGDPVEAFAAFKAKAGHAAKLATTPEGIVPNVLLQHWLFARHAVPRDLVEIAPMSLPAMQASITTGVADGATLPEPISTIVRSRNPRLQRITTGNDMFPDMPGVVLGASDRLIDSHPELCRALVQGIAAATRMIHESPADAAPLVVEALGVAGPSRALVGKALASSNLGFVTDPHAIESSTRRLIAYQHYLGDFAAEPDLRDLFDTRFFVQP